MRKSTHQENPTYLTLPTSCFKNAYFTPFFPSCSAFSFKILSFSSTLPTFLLTCFLLCSLLSSLPACITSLRPSFPPPCTNLAATFCSLALSIALVKVWSSIASSLYFPLGNCRGVPFLANFFNFMAFLAAFATLVAEFLDVPGLAPTIFLDPCTILISRSIV
jgi:hypothetical protein